MPAPGPVGRLAVITPPDDVAPPAAGFLKLLADPTRRRIFLILMRGETCNCEIAAELGLPENLVSHHIRRLREAGLADEHPDPADSRWVHFTVSAAGLSAAWEALRAAFATERLGSRASACRVRVSGERRPTAGRR